MGMLDSGKSVFGGLTAAVTAAFGGASAAHAASVEAAAKFVAPTATASATFGDLMAPQGPAVEAVAAIDKRDNPGRDAAVPGAAKKGGGAEGISRAEGEVLARAEKLIEGWLKSPPAQTDALKRMERVLLGALVPKNEGLFGSAEISRLRDHRPYDVFSQNRVDGDGLNQGETVYALARPFIKANVLGGCYRDLLQKLGLNGGRWVPHVGVGQRSDRSLTHVFGVNDAPIEVVADMVRYGFPSAALDVVTGWVESNLETRHWEAKEPAVGVEYHLSYLTLGLGEKEFPKVMAAIRKMDATDQMSGFAAQVEKTAKALEAFFKANGERPINVEDAKAFYYKGDPKEKKINRDQVAKSLWMSYQLDKLDAAFRIVATCPREQAIPDKEIQALATGRFGDALRVLVATGEPMRISLKELVDAAAVDFVASPTAATDLPGAMAKKVTDLGRDFFDRGTAHGARWEVLARYVFKFAQLDGLPDAEAGKQANAFRELLTKLDGESEADYDKRIWGEAGKVAERAVRLQQNQGRVAAANEVVEKPAK